MNKLFEEVVFVTRYARWLDEKGRRETWPETVSRYIDYFRKKFPHISEDLYSELYNYILNKEIMPSMRAMATAGPALDRSPAAGYNCSYVEVDSFKSFSEILFLLMNGTGVGFSVEARCVEKLPMVPRNFTKVSATITIEDSKEGWADALYSLLNDYLSKGFVPDVDYSRIRPSGSKLKTFGGRASGPEPLKGLMEFVVEKFKSKAGEKLTSLDCHDIVCKIAEIVVVGGVRRSALISLSDLSDQLMATAKSGNWWEKNPQRALANNSAVYLTDTLDPVEFMKEWSNLVASNSGERGIFSRWAAVQKAVFSCNRVEYPFGTNPCGEIILRPNQFCNLSEVIVRPWDSAQSLKYKVQLATILGTFQSSLTDFTYLGTQWKENCEEERLLGVSFTGIWDNEKFWRADPKLLQELKIHAVETNKFYSKKLGINSSKAITCVKPSGTVSALCGTSSGIHPPYDSYYIRRIRQDKKDPVTEFLIHSGVPHEQDVFNSEAVVFSFPMKAPNLKVSSRNLDPLLHMEVWHKFNTNWAQHNVSITVSVDKNRWLDVGAFVYKHMPEMVGMSFLPRSDHIYQQTPFESISEDKYYQLVNQMPSRLDWALLEKFEQTDTTKAVQEFACTGDSCTLL